MTSMNHLFFFKSNKKGVSILIEPTMPYHFTPAGGLPLPSYYHHGCPMLYTSDYAHLLKSLKATFILFLPSVLRGPELRQVADETLSRVEEVDG